MRGKKVAAAAAGGSGAPLDDAIRDAYDKSFDEHGKSPDKIVADPDLASEFYQDVKDRYSGVLPEHADLMAHFINLRRKSLLPRKQRNYNGRNGKPKPK